MASSVALMRSHAPVVRRSPRLMNGAGLSVVDPVLGETHDLPTPTERMWAALFAFDLVALHAVLPFNPDLNAHYQPTEQDEVIAESQIDPSREDEEDFDSYGRASHPRPLEYCLEHHRLDLARALLNAGASPNETTIENNRLLVAQASRTDLEFLKLLIEFSVEVNPTSNATNRDGPLYNAVEALQPEAVNVLMAAGARINDIKDYGAEHYNRYSCTPIVAALKQLKLPQAETIVDMLIAAGARVDRVDSNAQNALHHMASQNPSWVPKLVALGADPCGQNIDGQTPLHCVFPWRLSGDADEPARIVQTVQALLDHGAAIGAQDKAGRTPLSKALSCQMPLDVMRFLLNAGADPYCASERGQTVRSQVEHDLWQDPDSNPLYLNAVLSLFIEFEQAQLRALADQAVLTVTPRQARRRL